jgi:hypothetical protein
VPADMTSMPVGVAEVGVAEVEAADPAAAEVDVAEVGDEEARRAGAGRTAPRHVPARTGAFVEQPVTKPVTVTIPSAATTHFRMAPDLIAPRRPGPPTRRRVAP